MAFNRADNITFANAVSGAGGIVQLGRGRTTLSGINALTGASIVQDGTLVVSGVLGGTTQVQAGTLTGTGTVGSTTVANGATLAGRAGQRLTIDGDLVLGNQAILDVELGVPSTAGLFQVNGNLTLGGLLDITDLGGFGQGLYRIIDYNGALTDSGLIIRLLPDGIAPGSVNVQTSVANQVNLISTDGALLNYWDGPNTVGDGNVNGGTGTWNMATNNWTEADGVVNAAWNSGFAIFQGDSGIVTVDESLGAIRAEGMQFVVDGYEVQGDKITLTDDRSLIRVGDGTLAGAGTTATIRAVLAGNVTLVKSDYGTLVLEAQNTFNGGVVVDEGAVSVSSDVSLGAASGLVTLENGTFRNTAAFTTAREFIMGEDGGTFDTLADLTVSGVISGAESLTKIGNSTLTLTADNTYGAGTIIDAGAIQLGNGGTSGWISGDVANDGQLIFNRSDDVVFSGLLAGSGKIIQVGAGSTTLTAENDLLSGQHEIRAGALAINNELGGTLRILGGELRGVGIVGSTTLEANGVISPGNSSGTLTIRGDFIGNGGLLKMQTVLGGDNSPTDQLKITNSAYGNARISVVNLGGTGAATVEGIKLVDIIDGSFATFTLVGDYVFKGEQAVVGGAYAYRLYKGGIENPNDGDWYLRSEVNNPPDPTPDPEPGPGPVPPTPKPPTYQPGVPIYEAYPQALLALNGLTTLQQRVGNRSWANGAQGQGGYGISSANENTGAWVRVEGGIAKIHPRSSTTNSTFNQDVFKLQAGVDHVIGQNETGTFVAGASVNTAYGKTKVHSEHGDGHIRSEGFGVGGSVTWYGNDGAYVDGQAQVMWYRSDLRSGLVQEKLEDRNHGTGYALSLEAGKQIELNDTWTLTPQGQLTYSSVTFDSFSDAFDVRVKMDRGDSFLGRLGLGVSRQNSWTQDDGKTARSYLYGIANLTHEFAGRTRVDVAGVPINARNGRTGAELGFGGTYNWNNDRYAVFGGATAGSNFHNFGKSYDVKAQVGFRMVW